MVFDISCSKVLQHSTSAVLNLSQLKVSINSSIVNALHCNHLVLWAKVLHTLCCHPQTLLDYFFVDLSLLSDFWQVQTWLELNDRLMPNGRLMVNCGGIDEAADVIDGVVHPKNSSIDGTWVQNYTIKALSKAFPGKVGILSWKYYVHLWTNMAASFSRNT